MTAERPRGRDTGSEDNDQQGRQDQRQSLTAEPHTKYAFRRRYPERSTYREQTGCLGSMSVAQRTFSGWKLGGDSVLTPIPRVWFSRPDAAR